MFAIFAQFLTSAAAIVVAGIFLVRSCDRIGELTKMGRLFAGTVFLAGATSLPELLVDLSALKKGMPDLAVGDLMGSSLMNLMVLATADLLHRGPAKMISRAGAEHALSAAISINMTAIACLAIFLAPKLGAVDLTEIGFGPLAIGLAYILGLRLVYYDRAQTVHGDRPSDFGPRPLARALSTYFASGLAIFIAAPYLADAAGKVADITGAGKTFVGSTMVAFCTSLPEIVSTIAAVRMGAFELAVGNIFGSNSFNMILLIPLDFVFPGSLLASVSSVHVLTGLAIILATSVTVMGQLYQAQRRARFIEPDAFTVLAIAIAALGLLYWVETA